MSDIKLFRLQSGKAKEIQGVASGLEKPLQSLLEQNLEELLGVKFLASEHSTGKTHAGRIDTLGIDEDSCPVILEYKRSIGENVINQGLFYLDWLMDHKAEFQLLVLKRYGSKIADVIDWTGPRLICVAADFTKYDGHAVQQMNRNIELIRYRQFGADLMLLELVNSIASTAPANKGGAKTTNGKAAGKDQAGDKTVAQWFASMPPELRAQGSQGLCSVQTSSQLRDRGLQERPAISHAASRSFADSTGRGFLAGCPQDRTLGHRRPRALDPKPQGPGSCEAADSEGVRRLGLQ
jgi:hypothetical protein